MSYKTKLQKQINQLHPGYFAHLNTSKVVKVGDYGYFSDFTFDRDSNLKECVSSAKDITKNTNNSQVNYESNIKFGTKAEVKMGGENVTPVNICFMDEGAFLYHLDGVTDQEFQDRKSVFEELGKLLLTDEEFLWSDEYVIVDSVMSTSAGRIFISKSNGTELCFNCFPYQDSRAPLANISMNVNLTKDSKMVLRVDIENKMTTILIKLVKPVFSPQSPDNTGGAAVMLHTALETVKSWFFGKMPKPNEIMLSDYQVNYGNQSGKFHKIGDDESFIRMTLKEIGYEEFDTNDPDGTKYKAEEEIRVEEVQVLEGQKII
ncbi:MAG: hypothetical protein OQK82_07550 [Candidatus Pacearchaeota archaeon]|nr:hypothetical protein [Candidatus Pacearchaeota archaeon]